MLGKLRPYFAHMPGSVFFFQNAKKRLNAVLREGHNLPVSVPTWFVTFSPADTFWPELYRAVFPNLSSNDIHLLSSSVRARVLGSYPEYAAQLFYQRWQLFFKHVLNGRSKPLGTIVDFFFRIEFQMRGSPHVHMLMWVLEAARAMKLLETPDGQQRLAAMTDKFIKCWVLPVETGECCVVSRGSTWIVYIRS